MANNQNKNKNGVSALDTLAICIVKAGIDTTNLLVQGCCKMVGYKSPQQKEFEKEQIEKKNLEREEQEKQLNRVVFEGQFFDFNDLFENCGLKNRKSQTPILKDEKHLNNVDIYSFKLPVGLTLSQVRGKIEEIADFFEVKIMDIQLRKKHGLMDLIVLKGDIFKEYFKFKPLPVSEGIKIPIGHFINSEYLEKMLVVDISHDNIPHVFVASTTGGGKSNFISVAIYNWILTKSPLDIEIFLLDGKGGADYAQFMEAPHIYNNKCYSQGEEVLEILEMLVSEIERRNNLFFNKRIKNYQEYSEKIGKMPYLMIIFDEYASYADDKNLYPKIQACVKKIASMGRSAGVHILVSTQDGRQAILDSMIKYNIPLKIGFKCENAQHSKNICGYEGLEQINVVGVGRVYGLPIETEYIQFKSLVIPDSESVMNTIKRKFSNYRKNTKSKVVSFSNNHILGEECEE